MRGERLIREENQYLRGICDFLGLLGIDLTEKKREV